MVFIWNGIYSKVVEDEEFEKNHTSYRGYVVVRRLYVALPFCNKILAKNCLYKRFRDYGAIESIKIKEDTNEGYVTFVSDGAAYEAFLVERVDRSGIRIEIAFPWHQPKPKIEASKVDDGAKRIKMEGSDKPPILEMCVDLLFMIFDRCNNATLDNLSETCVRFSNLLEKHYRFPKIDKTLRVRLNSEKSLTDLHTTVRLMGRYFEKLNFGVHGGTVEDTIICRYLQEINKYCTNIRHMRFIVKVFRNDFIYLLEPIFKNLSTLEIYLESEVNPEIKFTQLLPKLKKIYLPSALLGNCLKKSWPSLESFHCDYAFHEVEKIFFAFNPQLRCLEFDNNGIDNLEAAAVHLPNIEKVKLRGFSTDFNTLNHIQRFINLNELKIGRIDRQKLNELREHISNLKNLKKLLIGLSFPNREETNKQEQQMVVSLAKTNRNLERFDLLDLKLDEATVVDFVRFASKLNSLHLRSCGIFATASLITKIVDVRKCNPKNTKKLELFIDKSDQNDFGTINENEVQRYLNVNICEHIICFWEEV